MQHILVIWLRYRRVETLCRFEGKLRQCDSLAAHDERNTMWPCLTSMMAFRRKPLLVKDPPVALSQPCDVNHRDLLYLMPLERGGQSRTYIAVISEPRRPQAQRLKK